METADLIKKRIDILDLVSDYVTVKKAGRNYKALCPFHTEKTASFMVNPERGIFKCFGCGKGGDIFVFLQEAEHLEFPEALRILAKRAGVELKEYSPSPTAKLREKVLDAQTLAAKFYQSILLSHGGGKPALDYLKKRGLNLATIKEWGLGYAPNQWEVVSSALSSKGYTSDEIIATGLGAASDRGRGPYDRFRGRIMFPIRDITGRVVGFSGRTLAGEEPKYMNSPDSLVYQKSSLLYGLDLAKGEIKKENLAVLVEGNIDAISSYQAGVKNVVAPLGTALTSSQVALIQRFAETAALAFDADLAGDSATRRGIELAEDAGLNIRVIHLSGKDPDEVITQSPKAWVEAVSRATPIYDFYLDSAFGKADSDTPEGKRKIAREVLPTLAKITDPILRGHYLKVVSVKLGLEEKDLEAALAKVKTPTSSKEFQPVATATLGRTRQYQLEEETIKIVLELKVRPTLLIVEDFTDDKLAKIWVGLTRAIPSGEKDEGGLTASSKFDTQTFVTKLPDEAVETFDEILLKLRSEEELDEVLEHKVLLSTAQELRRTSLRRFMRKLGLMIKQAHLDGKNKEVNKLNLKFKDLVGKLAALETKNA